MEKEFIPYEQALSLKELGFYEQCLGCYIVDKTKNGEVPHFRLFDRNTHCQVLTPTFSQVFKWFREKHKLEASIQRMPPELYGKGNVKNYLAYIWAENLNPRGQVTLNCETYEEAELENLNKLIEIAKK